MREEEEEEEVHLEFAPIAETAEAMCEDEMVEEEEVYYTGLRVCE